MKSKKVFSTLKLYRFKSILFSNFFRIFVFSFAILIAFFAYVYNATSKASINELRMQHEKVIQNVSSNVSLIFRQLEYTVAGLAVNGNVKNYITSDAEPDYDEMNTLKQTVVADSSMRYVESIYVYSEKKNKVLTSQGEYDFDKFPDKGWIGSYKGNALYNNAVVIRDLNGGYPRFVTFLNKVNIGSTAGAIVVNVNVERFGNMLMESLSGDTFIYFLDSNDKIIYKSKRGHLDEDFLKKIISEDDSGNIAENDGNKYACEFSNLEKYGVKLLGISAFGAYNGQMKNNLFMIFIFAPLLLILGIGISIYLAYGSFKPLSEIMELLGDSFDYKEYDNVQDDEAKFIVDKIMILLDDNDKLRSELVEQFMKYNEVQMAALQGQINPHFINNTLQMINNELTASNDIDTASSMIVKLSRLLKYAYGYSDVLIDIEEEIILSKQYVELLKKRYCNFTDEWIVEGDLEGVRVPRFILQPILENAVYHGLNEKNEGGILKISIYAFKDDVVIEIYDNGKGIPQKTKEDIFEAIGDKSVIAEKVGIINVYKRMHIVFGEKLGFDIDSEKDKYTKIVFTIPKNK